METMKSTKEKIYDAAVLLFSQKGYGKTTTRQIAAEAGVKQSALYWAYKNKDEILEDILTTFGRKLEGYLLSKEEADRLIEKLSPRELLERCNPIFREGEEEFMYRAYKIVCMEQFTSSKAADIFIGQLHDKTAKTIQHVLEILIEQHKIPECNAEFVAELWTQTKFYDFISWIHTMEKYGIQGTENIRSANQQMIELALKGDTKIADS